MKARWVAVCFAAAFCLQAAPGPLERAGALTDSGDFKGAAVVLNEALQTPGLTLEARKKLEFRLDVLGRIKQDYSWSRDDLFGALSRSVNSLTRPELDRWIAEGRFDRKIIDGRECFVNVSVPNLFFRYPELASRKSGRKEDWQEQKHRLEVSRLIRKAAHEQKSPYVLPHEFVCTMSVWTDNGAVRPGDVIRAWLPIPRAYPFQNNFKLLNTSAPVKFLAPDTSPIRSVCIDQSSSEEGSARFEISYSYTMSGVYFEMDPAKIQPADLSDPILKKYTSEAPHVVFTDKIKKLAAQAAGSQTNPMLEARAFYDWIGDNVKYSFAREYSTLANISDDCLSNRYGDCGQESLLFITLCRSRGIPARWQSGWNTFPHATANHDWSEIYLAPYGWVPVDPCMGMSALRYGGALTPAERRELHDFYFGGLDYYRMAANSDHSQQLDPPKQSLRSDDVDFQRGELECGQTNLYFDKYNFDLRVKEQK